MTILKDEGSIYDGNVVLCHELPVMWLKFENIIAFHRPSPREQPSTYLSRQHASS